MYIDRPSRLLAIPNGRLRLDNNMLITFLKCVPRGDRGNDTT